jgi:hypothetical protein
VSGGGTPGRPARALLVLLFGGLLALATACATAGGYTSGAPTTPAAPPSGPVTSTTQDPAVHSAAMAAPITAVPQGTYRNQITPEGPQTLIIGVGASYTQLVTSSGQSWQGTLAQDAAGRVTFTNAAGAPCAGQPGVYRVNVNGSILDMQTVTDSCPSRAQAFTSGPWSK